jgi:hypothetical protein
LYVLAAAEQLELVVLVIAAHLKELVHLVEQEQEQELIQHQVLELQVLVDL